MKKLLLLTVLLLSNFAHAELKDFDHYMNKTCEEMTNKDSQDEFIQFTSKEILSDLGPDFCSKVVESSDEFNDLIDQQERTATSQRVGPAEFGKLIDSLYQYYESIH
jgi:hypothetical protein